MDPLGYRHEHTGGFPLEVSATGNYGNSLMIFVAEVIASFYVYKYTLVGSCLQSRGASAIWFVIDKRR